MRSRIPTYKPILKPFLRSVSLGGVMPHLAGYWTSRAGNVAKGGTVLDSSGNGNHGVCKNNCHWVRGEGGIFRLATSDYLNITTLNNYGSSLNQAKTVWAGWLKTSTYDTQMNIIGTLNSEDGTACLLRLHQESQEDFAKNRIRVFVRDDNGMRLDGAVDQDTEIADGHWHHLLINVDTPNSKIDVILDLKNQPFTYKNRKELHNFSDFQYDMVVGALNSRGDVDNCFNGEINEAMFYDTLLTINQCEAHYNITRPWILGR